MNIFVIDDVPPESLAMLQALYSRDPASVLVHRKKVDASGPEKFMSKFYVGYGHASIGDCGSTTVFVEGVSMLAAKAIQDWALYRGQEASTRYMDFSNAQIDDPVDTARSAAIQQRWMEFYHAAQEPMAQHIRTLYPRQSGEDEATYERAAKARIFDVLRAFLPAGTRTNLSWHTDLRQAQDHLDWLVVHPDMTIRALSSEILGELRSKYPSSFRDSKSGDQAPLWRQRVADACTYFEDLEDYKYKDEKQKAVVNIGATLDSIALAPHVEMLGSRPKNAVLPRFLDRFGQIETSFLLDFGSFRDLQRHRNGVVQMPLLTTDFGFHPWYLDPMQMPAGLAADARKLIDAQVSEIARLDGAHAVYRQYYAAMGFRVACRVSQTLPAFVYRMELRSGPSVHPTLRATTKREVALFTSLFPEVRLYADLSDDAWSLRRGAQTILEKNAL